jgi:hypothetical protein
VENPVVFNGKVNMTWPADKEEQLDLLQPWRPEIRRLEKEIERLKDEIENIWREFKRIND